ncbi:MAG: extracellular solute-binding protein [Actinomycetota bacterium]|jgi:iron(III) transport system substrate-binding protein|nr:extracellular solute-binding protein [Actinomycetota bacterium]
MPEANPNGRGARHRRALGAGFVCAALVVGAAAGTTPALAAKKAKKKVPLIVYSAQGYDQAMVHAFQAATGIPTKLDTNSTGPLLAQIQASKNNPHWGLLWVDGQTAFAELDDEHLLVKHFEPKVKWNALGKRVIPKDKSFVPTGITLMAAVAYTSKVLKSPPTSWSTLLSPKWKNDVGMNTPTQSGPTYPFIAGIMNYLGSINKGKQFFQKLKANGLVIHTTNGPTLAALASGQIKLALVQSSAAIGAEHTAPTLKVKYLSPVTMLPSNIGIDAKSTKTEIAEAKRFASFVLSKLGQAVMKTGTPTGDSLYYPVVQGIKPRPELPSLASVKVQHTNPYVWGPREASINSWFVNTITK